MSHRVSYLERNGTTSYTSFPTLVTATAYARTVKAGKVVPGGCDDGNGLTVTKCAPPEVVQAERARLAHSILRERASEAYMEAGIETRLLGGAVAQALDAARGAYGNVMQESAVCACGKSCSRGTTTCYTCRRYA
jgi:hypothetical protein